MGNSQVMFQRALVRHGLIQGWDGRNVGSGLFRADAVRAEIRHKRLRNPDGAVRLLVSFQKGHIQPRQSRAGTVQGVAELVPAVGILVTQAHAARLVVRKTGTGGNFQILPLSRSPYFNIIRLGGGKAEVARAKFNHAVMQPQFLKDGFRMAAENFQLPERVFRL